MIVISISKNEFEIDIYDLVRAFYPNKLVKIINTAEDNTESFSSFIEYSNMIKSSSYNEKKEEKLEFELSICYEEDSIQINVRDHSGVFYTDRGEAPYVDKKVYKNSLKRLLYHCLSKLTGRELPWGTLTGVRPAKIALEQLENNIPRSQIEAYMKEQYLCSEDKVKISLQTASREYRLLKEMDYKNGYSIYIGIPFCPSTCLYCSFTSYPLTKYEHLVEQYLQALYKEITYAGTCLPNKKLTTIYLGGGTPTTLSADQLRKLLTQIKMNFNFTSVKEYTVEAGRPDSITAEKLQVLKEFGVTRISINPQSMRQKTLDLIGRKHTVDQVVKTFQLARALGHDNINMDIIIGLPGETKDDVAYTLQQIDQLKPDSLTVHTLAIKRAARLNIERSSFLDSVPSDTIEMQKITAEYAKKAGYLPYYMYRQKNMAENLENIGYAQYGKEGLYNILIMEDKQTILALGAGGLSKFIFYDENRIERVENVKSLKDYVERIDEMIERKRNFLKENY